MTEERLAEIKTWIGTPTWNASVPIWVGDKYKELVVEVERLRAVVAEYGAAIEEHHADFVKIKAIVTAAITQQGDAYGLAWVAVHEIDRIVR